MSVVRIKRHRDRFTVLSTGTLRTAALSLRARGLWAVCMSFPDDWEFLVRHLRTLSDHDGRDAVQNALKELEGAGLAGLDTLRSDDGRVRGRRWTIYEEPGLNPHFASAPASGEASEGSPEADSETDDRETRLSVEEGGDRQTGSPSDGDAVGRADRRTVDRPLRKNQYHEPPTPRKKEQQQATREAGRGPVPLRAVVGGAAAALSKEDGEGTPKAEPSVDLLVRRGVDRSVAGELAAAHGAEAVRRACGLYDERRRGPKPPVGPGWLVAALRRGFAGEAKAEAALVTHAEMLRWCDANGGSHRTSEFEPVRQPDGTALFRRRVT